MYNCFGVIMRGDLVFEFVVVCFDKWWLQSVFFLMANGNILELKLNVYLLYIFTEVEII